MYLTHWALDKRVIFFPVPSHPDFELVKKESSHISALLDEGIPPVVLLVDASKGVRIPASVMRIRSVIDWPYHPNLGCVIMYGDNRLFHFVGMVLGRITQMNFHVANTLPDALTILQHELPNIDTRALNLETPIL